MSFSKELEDFATTFNKTYTAVKPSAYDRHEAEKLEALRIGADAAGAAVGSGRTPNLGTDWTKSDTPGGATMTPNIAALPVVEGGEPSSSEMTDAIPSDLERAGITPRSGVKGSLPTFARGVSGAKLESDIAAAKAAITANESGGRYDAMGPVTASGDRAYGKYQVMGKNIPQWTQAAIGRAMTPQEFRNNPQAQEAVFERYFGDNLRKYGFDDAASIWFSGRRQAQAGKAKDVLGTTVPKYVSMARATYNKLRPTQSFSRGGLVQAVPFAATGGMIEETPAGEGNAEGHDLMELGEPTGIADIIDQAMSYGTKVFGLDRAAIQGADPRAADGARALAMNVGAAKPEQIETIHKTVDPRQEMNPAMRQIAGYKAIYQHWMARGEPEKAQRAVFAMAMAAKDAAQVYGTVALQAAQRGDAKMAADAIAKGYDEVPDGHTLKVTKAGPEGAQFELHDINGNITDKGQLAMDEMVRVATGMTNGTEWLKSMGAIRTRTDKTGARAERDRAAIEDFERSREPNENEFIATLTPEQRDKFAKMPWQAQRDFKKRHFDRLEAERKQGNVEYNQLSRELSQMQRQENRDTDREDRLKKQLNDMDFKEREVIRKQGNFETRMNTQTGQFEVRRRDANARWVAAHDDKLEKQAHDDRIKAFDMARRQKNWEAQRETQMSQFERRLAEEQLKNDDRYQSATENSDFRRQRAEEIDKRIMESAKVRRDAAAASGAARAARAPAAPRLTAPERQVQAVDTRADAALTRENMAVPEMTGFDAPEREAAFGEAAGRVGAARTYEAQEATRKGQPAVGDFEKIRTGISEATAKANLSPEKQNMLVGVASHIARANIDVDEPTAINIALAAGSRNTPIRFERDRLDPNKVRVQVGNTQPVVMGSEALSTIAMIRGGALRPSGVPAGQPTIVNPDRASTAGPTAALPVPGITGNPDQRVDRGGPRAMNSVEQAKITMAGHNLQKRKFKKERQRALEIEALTSGMPLP